MKVSLKTLSVALSALISVTASIPAFALDANYNYADNSISINGSSVSPEVALAVMPYRYTLDDLTVDIINSNDSVVFFTISAGGDYSADVLLPDNLPLGKFRLSEIIEGESEDTVFFRLSDDRIEDAVNRLNDAQTLSEVRAY